MTILLTILIIILAGVALVSIFLRQPKFGKMPVGERLLQIQQAPNYKDGKFQNQHHTPDLAEGVTYTQVLKEFLFEKSKRVKPKGKLPTRKTNLRELPHDKNGMVWFGHSSYFLQIDGKKILVDPVLSGAASPIRFTTKSFKGSDVYTTAELPEIDYLFLTHDHWDHLDYSTIINLKATVKKVICGLGVGEHLARWGYDASMVIEKNWEQEVVLDPGFKVRLSPARHFSGRGFKRQPTLWTSFILQAPTMKLFLGGDSGYDTHFASIGENDGPFDVAILECGQYNKNWKYIHMMPEETVQAAKDLQATYLVPVHWAKFALAQHDWDDPIKRVTASAAKQQQGICTPMIGEMLDLKNPAANLQWWEQVP